ncbi:hypothetical protein [Methylocystis parvus]|uniref:Uncharacterized protein n=1 Tax=Methylocystis parvus TaxID=134 RepID=A0A6B8MDS0_9HYPH|nr:hypothetical protein [Methylocystis parvus]QGM99443.1 hypothetical protein F7D14_19435 [Methylocystis parvus]WBK00165.1 hypothetical protein MMG94_00090 [Methylocystis parvus OBBP]
MQKKRPSGRDCALAQSALETLKERERREQELVASASPAIAPVVAMWRDARKGAIRLIDLERRARFARLAV